MVTSYFLFLGGPIALHGLVHFLNRTGPSLAEVVCANFDRISCEYYVYIYIYVIYTYTLPHIDVFRHAMNTWLVRTSMLSPLCHPVPSPSARDLACSLWIEDVPGILRNYVYVVKPKTCLADFPKTDDDWGFQWGGTPTMDGL